MTTPLPNTVTTVLGADASRDLAHWMEQALAESTVSRDEWVQFGNRLSVVEHDVADLKVEVRELRREMNERFDRINDRFDRINERFDRVNERFDHLNERFDDRLDQMHELMARQMRWTIGLLALFGTMTTVLLGISQLSR